MACCHISKDIHTVKVVPQDQADKIEAPSRRPRSLQRQNHKGPSSLPVHRTNIYILFKQPFRSSHEGDPNRTRTEHPQDQEAPLLETRLFLCSASTVDDKATWRVSRSPKVARSGGVPRTPRVENQPLLNPSYDFESRSIGKKVQGKTKHLEISSTDS